MAAPTISRVSLQGGLWSSKGKASVATVDARITIGLKAHGAALHIRGVGRSIFATNNSCMSLACPVVPAALTVSLLSFADAAERVSVCLSAANTI
jgi:hypothetical protein